jgi:ribosome maturation factor RimP
VFGVFGMQADWIDKFKDMARTISEREGCLLYDVEMSGGPQGRVLRVYIDRSEGQVGVDDCANVSRGLNSILDVEDVIPGGAYELEVSSPGIERRLTADWHFAKAVGQPVRVKLSEPIQAATNTPPRQVLDGDLIGFENQMITVRSEQKDWVIGLKQIAKAQVRFVSPSSHGKGQKKR